MRCAAPCAGFDRHDRLMPLKPYSVHHQAQRRAVRCGSARRTCRWPTGSSDAASSMAALRDTAIDDRGADAGSAAGREVVEGDELRVRGRLEAPEHVGQRHAQPGDHHRPAFHAAHAVDALFRHQALEQGLQRDGAGLRARAADRDRPGRGDQGLRRTRGIGLAAAELVEVVVRGRVLVAGPGLVGVEASAARGGRGAGDVDRRRWLASAAGDRKRRCQRERLQESAGGSRLDRFAGIAESGTGGRRLRAIGCSSRAEQGIHPTRGAVHRGRAPSCLPVFALRHTGSPSVTRESAMAVPTTSATGPAMLPSRGCSRPVGR